MYNSVFLRTPKDTLYMLEFLIHELKIFSSEVKEIDNHFYVSANFANLPTFIINPQDFPDVINKTKVKSDTNGITIKFDIGKSCIFCCNPSKLKNWIQEPLKVAIYKTQLNSTSNNRDEEKEESPICETNIYLSDSLLDFEKVQEENRNIEKSTSITNTFNLSNKENNPFGTIKIFLRFSCLGKLLTTKFASTGDSFLFKTAHSLNEVESLKNPMNCIDTSQDSNSDTDDIGDIEPEINPISTTNILGLHLVCEDLAKTVGGRKENVSMNSMERSSTPYTIKKTTLSQYDLNRCDPSYQNKGSFNSNLFHMSNNSGDSEYSFSKSPRLRGGACGGGKSKDNYNEERQNLGSSNSVNTDQCSCNKSNGNLKNCDKVEFNDNLKNCDKYEFNENLKNCVSVEGFQKRIKEAQEFVDSLGKKSGFAGLGILGPNESPYFGRQKDCENGNRLKGNPNELEIPAKKINRKFKKSNVHCYSFGNVNIKKEKLDNSSKLNNFNILEYPSKNQVERQLHIDKLKNINASDTGISTMFQKNDNYAATFPSNQSSRMLINNDGKRIKRKRKQARRKRKTFKIKSYDLIASHSDATKSSIKVDKRIMKHAYAMREYNPGIYYGHRNCLNLNMRIPANMGWMWNTCNDPGIPKPRYGWKPGAISKHVYYLLMKAKSESGVSTAEEKPALPVQGKKSKSPETKSLHSFTSSKQKLIDKSEYVEDESSPLIQVHRKDGDYYVTINPAKQGDSKAKPLQLKISKNDDNDDDASNSSAPDFQLACSPPGHPPEEAKKETKDADTQVKQQEILDTFKTPGTKPPANPKAKKAKPKK